MVELVNLSKDWAKALTDKDSKRDHVAFFSIGSWSHKIALMVLPLAAAAGQKVIYLSESIFSGKNCLRSYLNSNFKVKTELSSSEIRRLLTKNKAAIFSIPKPISAFFEKQINSFVKRKTPLSKISLNLLTKYFIVLALLSGAKRILVDLRIAPDSICSNQAMARELALSWQRAAHNFNISTCFLLINMIQPLGNSLGCHLQAAEVIQSLKGNGPLDLLKLSLEIATELIFPGQKIAERMEIKKLLKRKLANQQALLKLKEIIEDQGGEISYEDYLIPPSETAPTRVLAEKTGYVQRFNLKKFLILRARLKDWNTKANSNSCYKDGIIINSKIGDKVGKDESLAEIYFHKSFEASTWSDLIKNIFVLSPFPPPFQPFVIEKLKNNFRSTP